MPFAGSTAPAGSLLCYGQAISRTAYAGLFATLSTAHGAGDGSTTFNLPDLRGRAVAGKDDMGGSSAARLNSISSTTLGAAGGGQINATSVSGSISGGTAGSLSINGITDVDSASSATQSGGPLAVSGHTHTHTVSGGTSGSLSVAGSFSGSSASFSVVQPTMILNYLIRIEDRHAEP